jgi:cytochrome b561
MKLAFRRSHDESRGSAMTTNMDTSAAPSLPSAGGPLSNDRRGRMVAGRLPRTMAIKLSIDLVMTLLFIASLAFRITGDAPHEWLGVALCALFVVHGLINWRWFRNVFSGRYRFRRTLNTVINLSLLLAMLVLAVCGMANSRHVLGFLQLSGGMEFRQIHSFTAYWGLVLIGIHAGTHWTTVINAARKMAGIKGESRFRKTLLRILAAVTLVCGVWASYDRDMGSKLFRGFSFDFWDPSRPIVLFFVSNLAILGFYIGMTHFCMKFGRP